MSTVLKYLRTAAGWVAVLGVLIYLSLLLSAGSTAITTGTGSAILWPVLLFAVQLIFGGGAAYGLLGLLLRFAGRNTPKQ